MKTLSIALALAGLPLTSAADDCIPILSAPTIITTPGRYCLTGDLEFTPAVPISHAAVLVMADAVTVDLEGFTIRSTVPGWGMGVAMDGFRRGIAVVNGTVSGFFNGVRLEGVSSGRAEACRVENVTVRDGSSSGIRVLGTGCVVRGNRVSNIVGRSDIGSNTVGISLAGWAHTALDNEVAEIYGAVPGLTASGFVANPCYRCVFEANRVKNSRMEALSVGMYIPNSTDVLVVGNRIQQWASCLQLTAGKYRDNLTAGCPASYSGGINAGNNQ
jgi:hypothetical protein